MSEANKAVVRDFVDAAWRRGDLTALERFWTEDCVNHAARVGQQAGFGALRAYHLELLNAFAAFEDVRTEVALQVAEADLVTTRLVSTGRQVGAFGGVEPTGREASLAAIRIDRLRGGRICEHWSVSDVAGLLAQLQA